MVYFTEDASDSDPIRNLEISMRDVMLVSSTFMFGASYPGTLHYNTKKGISTPNSLTSGH